MHGLVGGFGKGFCRGAVAVVDQVGRHHPGEREDNTVVEIHESNQVWDLYNRH